MTAVSETLFISPHKGIDTSLRALVCMAGGFPTSRSISINVESAQCWEESGQEVESSWGVSAEKKEIRENSLDAFLFCSCSAFRLAVLSQELLRKALLRLNPRANTSAPMALARIDGKRATGTVVRTFSGSEEFLDYLLSQSLRESRSDLMISLPLSLGGEQNSHSRADVVKIGSWSLEAVAARTRLEKVALELERKLQENIQNLCSNCEMLGERKIEDELMSSIEVNVEQDHGKRMQQVEYRLKTLGEAERTTREEIEELKAALQAAATSTADEKTAIHRYILAYQSSLSRFESDLARCQRDIAATQERLQVATRSSWKPLCTIEDVKTCTDSMKPVASIRYTKQYNPPCELVISFSAEQRKLPITFQENPTTVELGHFDEFPTDQNFSLVVRSAVDGRPLSNESFHSIRATISLPSAPQGTRFQDSLVYALVGGIEDVERELVAKSGEAGLNAFRTLCLAWSNADAVKVADFVECCRRAEGLNEERMKQALVEAGFTFR